MRGQAFSAKGAVTMDRQKELSLLRRAMAEAEDAIRRGDEPYGAVIATPQGEMISVAGNEENTRCDPTAHAEMLAIRKASEIRGSKSLRGCVLVTNYKPRPMCAAAALMTGISSWVIGSVFPGAEQLFFQTAQKISSGELQIDQGLMEEECTQQVHRGRSLLTEKNKNYHSGHKNGII